MKILLIEDEPRIVAFIRKGLEQHGHTITAVYDGQDGCHVALHYDFDLVILDLMLPGLPGLDVCSQIKASKKELPVLILSALGSIGDKVEGFHHGADDYLLKPFHFEELLARINALLRRTQLAATAKTYRVADLQVHVGNRSVTRNGREIFLTVKEFELLEVLLANKGRVLSRAFLSEQVWQVDFNRRTNLVDVYINYLRAKIDKGYTPALIHTVTGVGYMLNDLYNPL
ncbi:response regulator transcription factor [Chitinophaga vietnamensis]|uniref:response regulator transcription factor n=1 Tax=Chitinophaga vietnamensis TaxID=2593957 RepID=UPI0011775F51|nr:response regulator transcription factor [Chitinophaga vietnamensis]